MDILDDFSGRSRETLTYHCIKEDCNNFKLISNSTNECLGAYVISMTSTASDILSVYFLQTQAKVKNL